MGVKYVCDGCSKELTDREYDYASKSFNLADDDLNIKVSVGAKGEENTRKVYCKLCGLTIVKALVDAKSKESMTEEVK